MIQMKRMSLMVLLAMVFAAAVGQNNINHLNMSVAALYERGLDATLSYEHETRYHDSWEYFVNGYIQWDEDPEAGHVTTDSFWHNYFTYNIGVAIQALCHARP